MFYLRFRAVCISRNDKLFFPIAAAWNGKSPGTNTGWFGLREQPTDRPIGGQTRRNVANVVIVIGLIFRCGATRRYGCGSLRIHESVETRLCSSFRSKRMPYWASRERYSIMSETRRNKIATRLRARMIPPIRHFFNYTANVTAVLSMCKVHGS